MYVRLGNLRCAGASCWYNVGRCQGDIHVESFWQRDGSSGRFVRGLDHEVNRREVALRELERELDSRTDIGPEPEGVGEQSCRGVALLQKVICCDIPSCQEAIRQVCELPTDSGEVLA